VAYEEHTVSGLYVLDLVGNWWRCDRVLGVRRSRRSDRQCQAERNDACGVQDATAGQLSIRLAVLHSVSLLSPSNEFDSMSRNAIDQRHRSDGNAAADSFHGHISCRTVRQGRGYPPQAPLRPRWIQV
jgi:hypothetical protein